jgi:hypothetical protein
VSATTTAITSPAYDVRPPTGIITGQSLWISPTRSTPGRSSAVNTASTPGAREGGGGVDRDDVGAGVVGEMQRCVQHAGHAHVVDVAAVAERERCRLVLRSAATDLGRQRGRADVAVGDRFDRVEDLDVAGAATEMCTEVWGHRVAGERCEPFLSIWALARITMPGMQKPHCSPPHAAKASANVWRSASSTPSSVTTDFPSTFARSYWQATVALPSTNTVQHPHCPDGEQPSFGDVMSSSSRSAASRCGCDPRTVTGCPLTSNAMRRSSPLVEVAGASASSVTLYSLSKPRPRRKPPR